MTTKIAREIHPAKKSTRNMILITKIAREIQNRSDLTPLATT